MIFKTCCTSKRIREISSLVGNGSQEVLLFKKNEIIVPRIYEKDPVEKEGKREKGEFLK